MSPLSRLRAGLSRRRSMCRVPQPPASVFSPLPAIRTLSPCVTWRDSDPAPPTSVSPPGPLSTIFTEPSPAAISVAPWVLRVSSLCAPVSRTICTPEGTVCAPLVLTTFDADLPRPGSHDPGILDCFDNRVFRPRREAAIQQRFKLAVAEIVDSHQNPLPSLRKRCSLNRPRRRGRREPAVVIYARASVSTRRGRSRPDAQAPFRADLKAKTHKGSRPAWLTHSTSRPRLLMIAEPRNTASALRMK